MKLIGIVIAIFLLGSLPAVCSEHSKSKGRPGIRNGGVNRKAEIKKVKKVLFSFDAYKNMPQAHRDNFNILIENLQPAPLKFIPKEVLVERLVGAYQDNLAVHMELKKLANIKTIEMNFEKTLENLQHPRPPVKIVMKKKKPDKIKLTRLMYCSPDWGKLRSLEKRYRNAQLELFYFASAKAIERINHNLGFAPVTDRYLKPMTNYPPYTGFDDCF